MSLYASISWGIVTGFIILDGWNLLKDYLERRLQHHRIQQLLEQLDDVWDNLDVKSKPVRKKSAVKKVAKRK
jgi:hypothetical protein